MKDGKLLIVGLCYVVSWGHVNPWRGQNRSVDSPCHVPDAVGSGIPGGIPADDDPTRPASVWLPEGDPYHGYSVDPSLVGTGNAAAFTAAFQAAIDAAGAAATPTHRRIVRLGAGTSSSIRRPSPAGWRALLSQVDNVTIRGEGASRTRIVADTRIGDLGTVILFGHRLGTSDASFALQNVTADAPRGSWTIQVANTSGYAVGDVITIDHVDGPAMDSGQAVINAEYLFFFDGQFFKRQPAYSCERPWDRCARVSEGHQFRVGQHGGAHGRTAVALDVAGNRGRGHCRRHADHQRSALYRFPPRAEAPGVAHGADQYRRDYGREPLERHRAPRCRRWEQRRGLTRVAAWP